MAEALGLAVAVVVRKGFVLFGAIVPGQFKETFTIAGLAFLRHTLGSRIAKEVEVESCVGSLAGSEEGHAQDLLVKLEGLLRILDTDHGVVLIRVSNQVLQCFGYSGDSYHAIGSDVSLLDAGSLLQRLLANNLNPISIGIQGKSNVVHSSLGQLLLELVAGILNALASGLEVVDGNAGVAKSAVRVLVSIVDGVVGVVLSAVVVGELNDSLAVKRRVSE